MTDASNDRPLSSGARLAAIAAMVVLSVITLAVFALLALTPKHYVASNAMRPTLRLDDYVAFEPGYLAGAPQAGDIFTFEVTTGDYQSLYLMRVIGLPGDRVSVSKGIVSINGQALPRKDLGEVEIAGEDVATRQWEETLPSGRSYLVLDNPADGPLDDMAEITVPQDRYFVMGDNRDNSNDSRAGIGTVERGAFASKALMIYFATGDKGIDFDRIGTWVR